ncbi:hypothetical protein FHX36_001363 [Modestobacter versicolor]|uniref:Uncharacterized protein n=1 Tax=Modestobacter versicolor TaxID=429133 RepID=A0A839XX88_9ACTN|nr:hypothetical protein [Modestobacter versicolor]
MPTTHGYLHALAAGLRGLVSGTVDEARLDAVLPG